MFVWFFALKKNFSALKKTSGRFYFLIDYLPPKSFHFLCQNIIFFSWKQ
jgi:hypothetical protein